MRRKHPFWLLSIFLSLTMLAAACGGDDDGGGGEATETTTTEEVPKGGTVVLGWEQEPDCVDWIGSCGGSSYGFWALGVTTLSRPYNIVKDAFGADAGRAVRIQYGGSVKPSNAAELLGQPDIDGALVGGASLEADDFAAVVQAN